MAGVAIIRTLDEAQLWLQAALPGERCIYWRGRLAEDRDPRTNQSAPTHRRAGPPAIATPVADFFREMADHVAYENGHSQSTAPIMGKALVTLVQRRRFGVTEYLAVKLGTVS